MDGQWAGVGVTINAANVTVDAGSKITADGQGYVTGCGPGGAAVDDYLPEDLMAARGEGRAAARPMVQPWRRPISARLEGPMGHRLERRWGCDTPDRIGDADQQRRYFRQRNSKSLTGYSGGASGGSIYATVGTLAGSGSFSANGTIRCLILHRQCRWGWRSSGDILYGKQRIRSHYGDGKPGR